MLQLLTEAIDRFLIGSQHACVHVTKRDCKAPVKVAMSMMSGAECSGIRHGIGQDQASFGIRIDDLDGFSEVGFDDVSGLCCLAAGQVFDGGYQSDYGCRGRSCASAIMAPRTAAPPAMSPFISSIFSEGLMEIPPLSNVTPFPTSA